MMSLADVQAGIRLHSVTHGHKAIAAAQRGDYQSAGRYNAIAAMAASGKPILPMPDESHHPDLVAVATEFGLVVPAEVPAIDEDACLNAIVQHGESARLQQLAASQNGNHSLAKRLDAIATAAAGGRLLAPLPGDPHRPDLYETADALGFVDPNRLGE